MTTKLQIIVPYTPEHEGPFCTREGEPVRLLTRTGGSSKFPIVGFVGDKNLPECWTREGRYLIVTEVGKRDLMNAREVPVAREFWINEYTNGQVTKAYTTEKEAHIFSDCCGYKRTIHVREVLPGDGE